MYRSAFLLVLVLLVPAPRVDAAECAAVPLCTVPVIGEGLRGDTVTFDGSATEGAPTSLEWFVTEPGDAVPVAPAATGQTANVLLSHSGRWSIGLRARYAHQAPSGGPYCDQTCVAIDVRSVDAVLSEAGPSVDVDEVLDLDGSASRWGAAVTPVMTWRIDGAVWAACGGSPSAPSQVSCEIAASSLGVGVHAVELELRDPVTGDVDTASASVEVVDPPPQTADFSWSPLHPLPNQVVAVEATTFPPLPLSGLVRVTWRWGDGTPDESALCPGLYVACTLSSHRFTAERRYLVSVVVETVEGDVVGSSHGVEVGSAQIFSDGFEAGLTAGWSPGP